MNSVNSVEEYDTLEGRVRFYNYTDLDYRCRLLALNIQRKKQEFDCILAVAGNGLFVGHLLSQYLSIPKVWTIGIGKDADARSYLYTPNPLFFMTRNVLLVDIMSRTGRTLQQAARFLKDVSVTRAVLFLFHESGVTPEFYVDDFGEDATLLFPWTKR